MKRENEEDGHNRKGASGSGSDSEISGAWCLGER